MIRFSIKTFILIFLLFSNFTAFNQCWQQISGGTLHTLGIKSDGTLWAWGDNSAGQLGIGQSGNTNIPSQIGKESNWKQISAGFNHSAAIKNNGTLWLWGYNFYGQLGDGTQTIQYQPIQINGTWNEVSAGASHTLAIKSDGTLWAWGNNDRAQAGGENGINQLTPFQVSSENNWISVSAGYYNSVALNKKGEIWAWGHAGNINDRALFAIPTKVKNDNDWLSISAGLSNVYAIKSNGTLWYFDAPSKNNTTGEPHWEGRVSQVGNENQWKTASSGYNYLLAVKNDGTLWGLGTNSDGQLADGYIGTTAFSPQQIGNQTNWEIPESGDFHGMALLKDGSLKTWGRNEEGQLGTGKWNQELLPVEVQCPVTRIGCWKDISAKSSYSFGIKDDGSLWAWGDNSFGHLGTGNTNPELQPVEVSPGTKWKKIYAGSISSFAIKSDNTIWAWGNNQMGQLGDGTKNYSSSPIQINAFSDVKQIIPIGSSTLVATNNGNVYGWGENIFGQLGNGNDIDVENPTISHNINWKKISGIGMCMYAIHNNGTLWGWGGCGLTEIPTQIGTDNDWDNLSSSDNFSVAIKKDGTLWFWGINNQTIKYYSPIKIGNDNDWIDISSGAQHAIMLKNNGTLWTFGSNLYGMGNGSNNDENEPIQIGTNSDWLKIHAGFRHNFAIKKDGTLWAWGHNEDGQLGDGTTINRFSPVQISCTNEIITHQNNQISKNKFIIYPNPVNDYLNIQGFSSLEIDKIIITDILGKQTQKSFHENQINIGDLNNGVYIIQLHLTNQKIVSTQFIKN